MAEVSAFPPLHYRSFGRTGNIFKILIPGISRACFYVRKEKASGPRVMDSRLEKHWTTLALGVLSLTQPGYSELKFYDFQRE